MIFFLAIFIYFSFPKVENSELDQLFKISKIQLGNFLN